MLTTSNAYQQQWNQMNSFSGLGYLQSSTIRTSIVNSEAYNKVVALEYKQNKKRKLKLLI